MRVSADLSPSPGAHALADGSTSIIVTDARQVTGLTDADLSGMAHGVQGLVTRGSALVQVSLVLRAGDQATRYDTSNIEAVRGNSLTAVRPVGGTLTQGRLTAHGSVEGTLSFVVPQDGASLRLRIAHTDRTIPLLRLKRSTAGVGGHSGHDSSTPETSTTPEPSSR